jgi:hypothetical protein
MSDLQKAWSIAVISWNSNFEAGHFGLYEENFEFILSDPQFEGARFLRMPKLASMNEKIEVLDTFLRNENIQHVFVTWLHDLGNDWTQFNKTINKHRVRFSGLAALTHLVVPKDGIPADIGSVNAGVIWANAIRSSGCVGLLSWDPRVLQIRCSKIKIGILKDFQPSELTVPSQQLINTNPPNRIGLFGQLFAYRGISMLADIATKNPDVHVYAVGRKVTTSIRADFRKESKLWKRLKSLPNVTVLDKYIETDEELNFYLSKMDLICLDTRNYPVPSGIVTRARNLGVPVAISSRDSAILSIYADDPGVIVLESHENISQLIANTQFSRQETTFEDFRISLMKFWEEVL